MAKDKANGDGTSADVHLVLHGKGGVGKSVVDTWLAEFLVGRGQAVRCIDGDPVNRVPGAMWLSVHSRTRVFVIGAGPVGLALIR
jgi:CO dehydrogenase nickel-insertion accessory protein CooC1